MGVDYKTTMQTCQSFYVLAETAGILRKLAGLRLPTLDCRSGLGRRLTARP